MRTHAYKQEAGVSFFEAVYALVRLIPRGRVTTYGAIAQCLGVKGSARMVGWALRQAGRYPDVPAHRVVNRHGLLTGKHHFEGERDMAQRLADEGVQVCEDKVQEFARLFWDPMQE